MSADDADGCAQWCLSFVVSALFVVALFVVGSALGVAFLLTYGGF